MSPDGERGARVALSFLAKPGDPVLLESQGRPGLTRSIEAVVRPPRPQST
jgi:hypothetical protein